MSAPKSRTQACPVCQTPLPGDAPMGLCPRCLISTPLFPVAIPVLPEQRARAGEDVADKVDLGDYDLLDEGREGGMGVVYRARQRRLDRVVALKMIRAKRFVRPSDLERFHTEVRATVAMDHDHIVRVYESGDFDGQPYFTMEWMGGGDLRHQLKALEGKPTGLALALEWMIPIARAVEHAHRRGVLHRDLNPRNILFDHEGKPHVSDFGLAKLLHSENELTRPGQGMGSPGYTSPEQAFGKIDGLTTASDVFSLGAILYQLVTGAAPFPTHDWATFHEAVAEREPRSPRSLNPRVTRDLETICLKCLEKDPSRRYPRASDLADELERCRAGEPISARPVAAWERTLMWARRKPLPAALAGGLLCAVALGVTGVVWQWRHAEMERRRTAESNIRLRLQRAEDHFNSDRAYLGLASLARQVREDPGNRAAAERLIHALDQRAFLLSFKPSANSFDWPDAVAPDGSVRALGVGTNSVTLVERESGRSRWHNALAHSRVIRSIRFSPDGSRILSAGDDRLAIVWMTGSGQKVFELMHPDAVHDAEFSPDGSRIVTASFDGAARLWDARNGQAIGDPMRHAKSLNTARFSPDGRFIVTASDDATMRVWDVLTTHAYSEPARLDHPVARAGFDPTGRSLRAVTDEGQGYAFRLRRPSDWKAVEAEQRLQLDGKRETQREARFRDLQVALQARYPGRILSLDVTSDGRCVAVGYADHTARLWQREPLMPLGEPLSHGDKVNCVRFSPDGLRLVSSTADRHVRVWDVATCQPLTDWIVWPDPNGGITGVQFAPDTDGLILSMNVKVPFYRVEGAAPPWLPILAERVAGVRMREGDLTETVPVDTEETLRSLLSSSEPGKPLTRWAKEILDSAP